MSLAGAFTNAYLIIGASLLILLVFSVLGVRKYCSTVNSSNNFFSKDQTNWLRGIAIVLIMYAHYYTELGSAKLGGVISQISNVGFLGVAIFLLLSGYAIMISKLNKPNYLKNYIPNRLIRLYIPFFITFILVCIADVLMGEQITGQNILGALILSLPNTINWYLKVQLGLYILFFVFALLFKDNRKLVIALYCSCFVYMAICIFAKVENYWFESCYMFPLGMSIAMHKDKLFAILRKKKWLTLIASFLFVFVSYAPYYLRGGLWFEILHIFGFTQFFICLCAVTNGSSKVLKYLGTISLELYLVHQVPIKMISYFGINNNFLGYVVLIAVSVPLAVLINKVCTPIMNFIKQKMLKSNKNNI